MASSSKAICWLFWAIMTLAVEISTKAKVHLTKHRFIQDSSSAVLNHWYSENQALSKRRTFQRLQQTATSTTTSSSPSLVHGLASSKSYCFYWANRFHIKWGSLKDSQGFWGEYEVHFFPFFGLKKNMRFFLWLWHEMSAFGSTQIVGFIIFRIGRWSFSLYQLHILSKFVCLFVSFFLFFFGFSLFCLDLHMLSGRWEKPILVFLRIGFALVWYVACIWSLTFLHHCYAYDFGSMKFFGILWLAYWSLFLFCSWDI